jgi:hypothetical protein
VIASSAIALTWPAAVNSATGYRWSVWRELASFVAHGSSAEIATWPQVTVFSWIGAGRLGAAAIVFGGGLGALAAALRIGWSSSRDPSVSESSRIDSRSPASSVSTS